MISEFHDIKMIIFGIILLIKTIMSSYEHQQMQKQPISHYSKHMADFSRMRLCLHQLKSSLKGQFTHTHTFAAFTSQVFVVNFVTVSVSYIL